MRIFTAFLMGSLALSLAASCFGGCNVYPGSAANGGEDGKISVASWNLQALFDGTDSGIEYEEYRDSAGWNEQKYLARLNSIAQAVSQIGKSGADILALVEVENAEILQKLSGEYLTKSEYRYSFWTGNPGYSLGVGALSRYPFTKTFTHSSNINGEKIPRPIAELWLEPNGKPLVIFICHWKSKLGGENVSEVMRRNAARIILRRMREIQTTDPQTPMLVLGDLNENYDEFYRQACEYVCALMPDDPQAAVLAGFALPASDSEEATGKPTNLPVQDFFIVSNEKPPVSSYFYGSEGVFYSPWGQELQPGSYFYHAEWETIDHFLLSPAFFDNTGWEYDTAFVMDVEPFVNSKGEPNIYNTRTGSGLSDHLPIVLSLKR